MEIIRVTDQFDLLQPAADMIRQGGLVAFPTETVYGLGANALLPEAAARIYEAKGRPSDNPLIVHISHLSQLDGIVREVSPQAKKLMDCFWPGPLTLILPKKDTIPKEVTAGLDTVGVRFPKHPVAQAFISMAGVPIAAPSANTSGKPSPTTAEHVIEDLDGKIDAVIDGGSSEVGLESTIVDVSEDVPVLLRPGGITYEQLKMVLGEIRLGQSVTQQLSATATAKAPGMKYPHYSPKAQVIVVKGKTVAVSRYINEQIKEQHRLGKKAGVMVYENTLPFVNEADVVLSLGEIEQKETAAARLFAHLRECDQRGAEVVYAQDCGEAGMGLAISNRLNKAAGYEIVEVE